MIHFSQLCFVNYFFSFTGWKNNFILSIEFIASFCLNFFFCVYKIVGVMFSLLFKYEIYCPEQKKIGLGNSNILYCLPVIHR